MESVAIFIEGTETEGPSITFISPADGTIFSAEEEIPIQVAITDNSGLSDVILTINAPAGWLAEDAHGFSDSRTEENLTTNIGDYLEPVPGNYLIAVEAIDIFGNEAKKKHTITIREPDTTAPTVVVSNPADGMGYNTDDVISIEDRATENVELGPYTISLTPPNGETQAVHSKEFADNSTEGNIRETIRLEAGAVAGNNSITIEVRACLNFYVKFF